MTEVLVTGGAGYIGSHMCVALLDAGYDVTVLDNLSNASRRALDAVERVSGKSLRFVDADVRDADALARLFDERPLSAVLHFAGLKAVGESVADPARYYDNNVVGSLRLFEAMADAGVKRLVFSSSATVYGLPETMPIDEEAATAPINPYGHSKLMIEQMLRDLAVADDEWHVSLLRYFNPVGAHPSGELGENPNGVPNNLLPFIAQVAVGRLPRLRVFGDDYPTPDGTGVRDYIHVQDLVDGHLRALEYLETHPGCSVHNLGTGRGISVLEMLKAFERACGRRIPFEIVERRPGDAASCYADPGKAERELRWSARLTLADMCGDAWRWQSAHPEGFDV